MATVRIQVIKVYDVETDAADPVATVEEMQSTEIEETGKLVDVSTEFAELVGEDNDEEEANALPWDPEQNRPL